MAADAALVLAASLGAPLSPAWETEIARGAAQVFPIKPADLMPALQGAALGAELRKLEDRWVASGFALTREDLLG